MAHTEITDMGFLDKLADWLAPSKPSVPSLASTPDLAAAQPPAPQFAPVPPELPRISERSAAELCKECKPDPAALQLLNPQQTPAQFLAVLQERNLGSDMVKVLAQGLPDREGVAWAVRCALKVADKLPPADALAMQAAQAWVEAPTAERQVAAAAAAERAELQGPGAWAAQAAAWVKTDVPTPVQSPVQDSAASEKPESQRLAPQAVSAAVLLSATILARPQFANLKLHMMQLAMGGVAGVSLGGVSVSQIAGAGAHIQAPGIGTVGSLSAPHVSVPQLAGAAGKVQAGLAAVAAAQSVGGLAGAAASLPGVAGAMSAVSSMGAGVHGGGAVSQMAAAVAHGGVLALPDAAAHALSGGALSGVTMPNMQIPGMANMNMPHISDPNMPHLPPPTVPPLALEFTFREQQPFIRIGLEIASGAIPLA